MRLEKYLSKYDFLNNGKLCYYDFVLLEIVYIMIRMEEGYID